MARRINYMTSTSHPLGYSKNRNIQNRPQRVFSRLVMLAPNFLKRLPLFVKNLSIGDSLETSDENLSTIKEKNCVKINQKQ